MRWLLLAAAAQLASAGAAAGQSLSVPDCDGLRAWIATQGEPHRFSAAVGLPAAYAPGAAAAALGAPFEAWSADDLRALDGALNACRSAASRAKDAEAQAAFAGARRDLAGATRAQRDAAAARETVAKGLAAADAAGADPRVAADLAALSAAPVEEMRALRLSNRDLIQVARAAAQLTIADAEQLRGALADRAAAVAVGVSDARLADIAATPESIEGMLAARRIAIAALQELGEAAAPVVAAGAAREAAIAASLTAAGAQPIVLPDCVALAEWGATIRPDETRRTAQGPISATLEAPELEAQFGKPFPAWSATDFAAMGALGQLCVDAARAGLLPGDARTAERGARAVQQLHARNADQPARFAALAEAAVRADALAGEIAAMPGTQFGLMGLANLDRRMRTERLDETDVTRLAALIAARQEDILGTLRSAMDEAPATLDGLWAASEAAVAYLRGLDIVYPNRPERQTLRAEALAALDALAPAVAAEFAAEVAALPDDASAEETLAALSSVIGPGPAWAPHAAAIAAKRDAIAAAEVEATLPGFVADLARLPASLDGLAQALAMGLQAEGRAGGASPAYYRLADAAAERARAIRAGLAEARCAPVADRLGARDAARPVLVGGRATLLGSFLCDLADKADAPPSYEGPGLFGSRHRIDLTVNGGYAVKLTLVEIDGPMGAKALVGQRIEDGAGARDVSTAEWQAWAEQAAGGGPDACGWLTAAVVEKFETTGFAEQGDFVSLAECLVARPEAPLPSLRQG